jgi:uncharacterized protein with von Willebrand factor type A (vWA) domain
VTDTGFVPNAESRLVDNILHFSRALRKAGVPVGTSQVISAVSAVAEAGFTTRADFFFALRATLVSRPEHLETFSQVFAMFWRDPEFLEKMMRSALPLLQTIEQAEQTPKPAQRRAAEALWERENSSEPPSERELLEVDAKLSWSSSELLQHQDFEQMSGTEMAEALQVLKSFRFPAPKLKSRRFSASLLGSRLDAPAMLRRSLRRGGEFDKLLLKKPKARPANLVVICDISGSMATYARVMMHFLHMLSWAQGSGWGHVHGFTFGTRLTNITRALRHRDIDLSLAALGKDAPDWRGGTRIGEALYRFNRDWSRRVLGQGAVVLLITDGLERGDTSQLGQEAARLARSCRRLIWLNPLLRYESFVPKAKGIRALLPVVDALHSCHSLNAISDMATALESPNEKLKMLELLRKTSET